MLTILAIILAIPLALFALLLLLLLWIGIDELHMGPRG